VYLMGVVTVSMVVSEGRGGEQPWTGSGSTRHDALVKLDANSNAVPLHPIKD
jgi:hypothetical protein